MDRYPPIVLLCTATVFCFLVAKYLGWQLRRHAESPLLAERMERHRRFFIGVPILGLVVGWMTSELAAELSPHVEPWEPSFTFIVPFVVFSAAWLMLVMLVADFPSRRELFRESWSLPAYLRVRVPMMIVDLHFFLLLCAPFLVVWAFDRFDWIAWVLFACLAAWNLGFGLILPRIMGGRPFADEKLFESLREYATQIRGKLPRIVLFGTADSNMAKVLTVPSAKSPLVLVGRPVIELLSPTELAAAMKREMLFNSQFNRRDIRSLNEIELLMALIGTFGFVGLCEVHEGLSRLALALWALAFIAWMHHRENLIYNREMSADRLAVSTGIDEEALIQSFEKRYSAELRPRRTRACELSSCQPTLSRHLALICGSREREAQSLGSPQVFFDRYDERSVVILDAKRITWLRMPRDFDRESGAAELVNFAVRRRSAAYRRLRYLCVRAGNEGASLKCLSRDEHIPEIVVRPQDEARLQKTLDGVDRQLPSLDLATIGSNRSVTGSSALFGAVAGLGLWEGLSSIGFIWLFFGLVFAPGRLGRPWLMSLGAASVSLALTPLLMSTRIEEWGPWTWSLVAVCGVLGAGTIAEAVRQREGEPAGPTGMFYLFLGTIFAFPHLVYLCRGDWFLGLYSMATRAPGVFVPFLAGGAALLAGTSKWGRFVGTCCFLLGLSHLMLGSDWWLREVVRDPAAAEIAPTRFEPAEHRLLSSAPVEDTHQGLNVSPGGRWFFTSKYQRPDKDQPAFNRFYISDTRGNSNQVVDALALAFVDDEKILAVRRVSDRAQLQLLSTAQPEQLHWRLTLTNAIGPNHVRLEIEDHRWRARLHVRLRQFKVMSGIIGSARLDERLATWSSDTIELDDQRQLVLRRGRGHRMCGTCGPGWMESYSEIYSFTRFHVTSNEATSTMLASSNAKGFFHWSVFNEVLTLRNNGTETLWSPDDSGRKLEPWLRLEQVDWNENRIMARAWDGRRLVMAQPFRLLLAEPSIDYYATIPFRASHDDRVSLALGSDTIAVLSRENKAMVFQLKLLAWPGPSK